MERVKTKQAIECTLAELMERKRLDKITVTQICQNSGIERQLFYYYYKDKYDVVNQFYQRNADRLVDTLRLSMPWEQVLNEILLHMKDHEEYYINAFHASGQNAFPVFLERYTYHMYSRVISAQGGPQVMSRQMCFSLEFFSHSASYMAAKWAKNKMREPTEFLAACFVNNISTDLGQYFTPASSASLPF